MANAAAKKAAAAKKETSSIFLPVIVILNLIHILLLYVKSSVVLSKGRIALTVLELIGTYISYQGILQDAEVGKLTRNKNNSSDMPGGVYLDVLGLILFVQYGSIFIGSFINWLLLIAPAVYGLMKWIKSKSSSSDADNKETEEDASLKKELEERRRKRSERRRQKRG